MAGVHAPAIPTAAANFDGLGDGVNGFTVNAAPPDTNIAVGPTLIVEQVNSSYAAFTKSGQRIFGPVATNTLWSGFGGGCQTDNDGDGIVRYDTLAGRWVLTQFALNGGNGPFFECIAVSQSADPTGSYYRYAFQYSEFPDGPKLGIWPDAFYITYDMFHAKAFIGAQVCALDRARMLTGSAATQKCFAPAPNYGSLLAADLDGTRPPAVGTPNYVVGLGVSNNDLALFRFHVDFQTPTNSTFTGPVSIAIAPYAVSCFDVCVSQQGTIQKLDSLGDRLMYRLAYRNFGDHEALVATHSVQVSGLFAIRWYELRPSAGTLAVFQQGTFAPDSNQRWMGSVAMDHLGDLAVGYSTSSSSIHPRIDYAGRLAADPLGVLSQGEGGVVAGGGSQSGLNMLSRWGDYSSMVADPDGCRFWHANEYLAANGEFNWRTRIAAFAFPQCATRHPVADFDGNGATDIAVYRPGTGQWFTRSSDPVQFGAPSNDVPVPADYDGDHVTDIAVYRPSTGGWFIRNGNPSYVQFGNGAGDVPVPGDYDGNGTTDIAVYRPGTGQWFIAGGATVQFGTPGDVPVPADYNGDGITDIAVYRPSTGGWFIRNGNPSYVQFGNGAGDVPVPGDYDGNGTTDIAVYRPGTGQWFVLGGNPSYAQFGTPPNDVPVPGDYNGDGTTDIAVYRPSTSQWFIRNGSPSYVQFGNGSDDVPLALPAAIRSHYFGP